MMQRSDDQVWRALSDPTRRALLDMMRDRPATTGDLCGRLDRLSRTAVMKHLGILEGAGLVLVRREGRLRWNHLNPAPIQRIHERWVRKHVGAIAASMLSLKRHAELRTTKRKVKIKKGEEVWRKRMTEL